MGRLVGYAFDAEFRVFEIEEKRGFESGDVEVAEHLSEVALVEGGDDFGGYDDLVFDDEVRDEGTDVLVVVVNRELSLGIRSKALFGELDDEGSFVELFVESGLEFVEYGVGGSYYLFGEFVWIHCLF